MPSLVLAAPVTLFGLVHAAAGRSCRFPLLAAGAVVDLVATAAGCTSCGPAKVLRR